MKREGFRGRMDLPLARDFRQRRFPMGDSSPKRLYSAGFV